MKQLKENLSVEKLKETQFAGGNVCLSSCGLYLFCILGSSLNVIEIKSGSTLHSLESEEEEITCVALSPNDKHLITSHRNLLLKQWDNWKDWSANDLIAIDNNESSEKKYKITTKCTRTWKAIHLAPVQFMCFDSTSTLLATASSDFTTKIWDIQAQYCTHNLKGSQAIIRCVRFHPLIEEIQTCVTGCEEGKLRVYDLNTSKLIACLDGHFSAITCFEYFNYMDLNKKYKHLISSSRDKVVIVWDLESFVKLRTLPIYESIESIFLLSSLVSNDKKDEKSNLNDRFFITMGNEGVLKLWDSKTSKILCKQNEIDSLKIINKRRSQLIDSNLEQCIIQSIFVKSINTLVLVTIDQSIVFVKLDNAAISNLIEKKSDSNILDVDLDSRNLFHVYKHFIGDHGEILDAQLLYSNENLLALATNSELIKLYNLDTWDCKLLKGHDDLVICLSVFNSRIKEKELDEEDKIFVDYLASSSKDSTIRLWRISRKIKEKTSDEFSNNLEIDCIATGIGHTQDVGALAFSRLGFDFLVSGSIDTTIKLWKLTDINNNKSMSKLTVKFTVKAHEKDINSICVSPNDKLIASGSSDRTAKIWNAEDGSCLAVLRGHKRGIWSVQFSTVDQLIATSSADATIKLWSLGDFSCFKTFEGHNTSVLKVNFLNNGTQMISTGSDGLLKLWNVKTNECVGTFDQHNDKAWALSINKKEEKFVTGGADGRLIIWKDITAEKKEEELEKRQEILLQEQELNNFLKEKKWKKALGLAILLNRPYKCYEIIKEILQQTDLIDEKNKGRKDLENTLLKLREDQIKSLIKYAIEWNTNTKFCHLAQVVFELILRNYPPEFLIENANNYEFSSKLVEQFLPYTERHKSRLNRLAQQIMFIDYTWSNMKLSDQDKNDSLK